MSNINQLVYESLTSNIKVYSVSNTENEIKIVNIILNLISKYHSKIPLLTKEIKVESNVIPHSHPIITLNSYPLRAKYPELSILKILIHENLHWYEAKYLSKSKKKILESKYSDIFNNSKDIQNDMRNKLDSFIIHIPVIWNELKIMESLVSPKIFKYLFEEEPVSVYKSVNKWIINNFDEIGKTLEDLDLKWKK